MLPILFLLAACDPDKNGPADAPPIEASAEVNEVVPTVVRVTWQLDGVTDAWIEWGLDTGYGRTVAIEPTADGSYTTDVLGLKASSEYHLRVVAETDQGQSVSDDLTVTTGDLPTGLPAIQVEHLDPDRAHDGYYVTNFVTPAVAMILDHDGDPVWWYWIDGWDMASRVHLAHDGQSLLMGDVNIQTSRQGLIGRVGLDGSDWVETQVPFRHHDFVELEDGTITTLAFSPYNVKGEIIAGEQVIEQAPDGTIRVVFDAVEWFDYLEETGGTVEGLTWPHGNAIDYLADEDAYLVSFLELGMIAMIDRQSGDPTWFLGGSKSDFALPGGSTDLFDVQHQMHWLGDDRIVVFENGSTLGGGISRAVEVQLDPGTGQAEELWSYSAETMLYNPVFGDVHRFDDGNTLVTFSYNGEIHEVTPEGDLVWRLATDLGGAVGYVTFMETLQPTH